MAKVKNLWEAVSAICSKANGQFNESQEINQGTCLYKTLPRFIVYENINKTLLFTHSRSGRLY